MAEVILSFTFDVSGPNGTTFHPRICGRERTDGLWEGWIEFEERGGPTVLRTGRETTQPNRPDLDYWATGITAAYLDGALLRLLRPAPVLGEPSYERPAYDAPAPHWPSVAEANAYVRPVARAVLDPFAVYAEGDNVLRQQLTALDAGQLRNVILAHGLSTEDAASLEQLSRVELMTIIIEAVRRRVRV